MKLPYGITGFYNVKEVPPPSVEEKRFKDICYAVLLHHNGTVLSFHTQLGATNFYQVQVKVFNRLIYILLNAHYPIIAFATEVKDSYILFTDESILSQGFSPYYTVYSKEELSKTFSLNTEHSLNDAELQQIAYWKPEKIGDLLFNFWD
ncbi:MAG TPA: hypothetical protein VNR38_20285 [Ureibacillus sp.]|uniref:hypothetical protein n=1 Tax=Peribacillus asahii TaxID=228899 RepID=UPI002079313F|nr:hypothetical protein [Peribacillus asahii]USK60145.1 hypothetical protein LIT37_01745 [Peribacillus asahii]HWL26057.1 hypothetical protein [Ureibacillus sp.]